MGRDFPPDDVYEEYLRLQKLAREDRKRAKAETKQVKKKLKRNEKIPARTLLGRPHRWRWIYCVSSIR